MDNKNNKSKNVFDRLDEISNKLDEMSPKAYKMDENKELSEEEIANMSSEEQRAFASQVRKSYNDSISKFISSADTTTYVFRGGPNVFHKIKWLLIGCMSLCLLFLFIDIICAATVCKCMEYSWFDFVVAAFLCAFLYFTIKSKYQMNKSEMLIKRPTKTMDVFNGLITIVNPTLMLSYNIASWVIGFFQVSMAIVHMTEEGHTACAVFSTLSLVWYILSIVLYQVLLARNYNLIVFRRYVPQTKELVTIIFDEKEKDEDYFKFDDEYLQEHPGTEYYFDSSLK